MLAQPSPKKGGSSGNPKRFPKKESLIKTLKSAPLSAELLLAIYDKLIVDLAHGEEASIVSSTQVLYRGTDLLAEAKSRKDWVKQIQSLTPEEVKSIDGKNPEWSQAWKTWKKSPTVTKAREILGLNPSMFTLKGELLKLDRLEFFRPKAKAETEVSAK